jgi:hypothetical protein
MNLSDDDGDDDDKEDNAPLVRQESGSGSGRSVTPASSSLKVHESAAASPRRGLGSAKA